MTAAFVRTLRKPYLHGHHPVVDENFLGKKVGADCGLIASTEFLVDLFSENCMLAMREMMGAGWRVVGGKAGPTYWFIKLVLPTPLSPRMIT